jgi:protein phosphatase
MATLFVMIGVSGSGKSTQAEKLLKELTAMGKPVVLIASDAIRGELCNGDQTDQSKNKLVFEVGHQRIDEALGAGINVIWDATNLSREERSKPIAIGRKHKATLIAVQIETPLTVAVERNRQRERQVPTPVIWKQHGRYYPATKQEFDTIMKVGLSGIETY